MLYFWWPVILLGVALQILVIAALLRGRYREFRLLFVYVLVLFLTTVIDAAIFYDRELYAQVSRYYWVTDLIRQALIFLVVLSFIHRALDRDRRALPVRVLWAGAGLAFFGLLFLTRDPTAVYWSRNLSRNLGFLAVILNLALWALLIRFRREDHVLLMVTGGMGLQMAGKAIGYSLRRLSSSTVVIGDLVIVLSHLLCLYIWWQAFRRRPTRPS
jgi:hypothetical protein